MTRRAALTVAAVFAANGAAFANWVARIPAIKDGVDASDGTLGVALLGIAAGSLVTMPFAGRWSERFTSRRVVVASMVAVAGAIAVLPQAPNVAALTAGLMAYGASFGVMDVAMNVQAVALVRRSGRPIMPWFHAAFSLGGLVGAGTGGLAATLDLAPTGHFMLVALAMTTVAVVARGQLLPDPPAVGAGAPEPGGIDGGDGRALPRAPVPRWLIVGLGLVAACATISEGAMGDWTTLFLRDVRGLDAGAAALGFAAFSVTMTVGRLGGEAAIRRFGAGQVLRAGGLSSAAGVLLAAAVPHPVAGIVGFGLVGLGMCCVFPLALTTAGEAGPGSGSREIARVSVIGYLGFLVGPPLIGLLAELVGLGGAILALVVPGLALAGLASVVERAQTPTPRPDLVPTPACP